MNETDSSSVGKVFPTGFLWGASTAAYQVEGGIENVDWAEAARKGKVPPCGSACDHYHKYEEDFDLIVALNQNAHRFSVEWARIEPEEGKFDQEAIEHYRKVIRSLKRRNIVPFINLWHFTLPLWFSESGGFLRKDAAEIFARYCAYVLEHLCSECEYWLTINEPHVYATNGFIRGFWPPFQFNPIRYIRVLNALSRAHKAAYKKMKGFRAEIQVGIAKNNMFFTSNGTPLNRLKATCMRWFWNHRFLRSIAGHQDFIGLNHYFYTKFGATAEEKERAIRNDMGWEINPDALYHCIKELAVYGLPIYVTENGIADSMDSKRADFILGYVGAIHKAISEGADVRGYFHWSLLDNYEWFEGFTQRFGLVAVDYATLKRTVRPSARVYAEICRTNALP